LPRDVESGSNEQDNKAYLLLDTFIPCHFFNKFYSNRPFLKSNKASVEAMSPRGCLDILKYVVMGEECDEVFTGMKELPAVHVVLECDQGEVVVTVGHREYICW
jgi:hypothetical protein